MGLNKISPRRKQEEEASLASWHVLHCHATHRSLTLLFDDRLLPVHHTRRFALFLGNNLWGRRCAGRLAVEEGGRSSFDSLGSRAHGRHGHGFQATAIERQGTWIFFLEISFARPRGCCFEIVKNILVRLLLRAHTTTMPWAEQVILSTYQKILLTVLYSVSRSLDSLFRQVTWT